MKTGKQSRPLWKTALLLSIVSSAVSACGETVHSVSALRPDKTHPDRFVCELAGSRPTITPNFAPNWAFIGSAPTVQEAVKRAQAEHRAYQERANARELTVVNYMLLVEGKLFTCFNNMTWQKDYYAGLPED